MAETRANFADLLDPIFRKIYNDQEKQLPEKRSMIFNELSSSKNNEKDSNMSGLSRLVEKAEGANITYEDRTQGYDVTYTHKTFALGGAVTHEMWEDDQHNEIRRISRDLATARVRHSEQLGADIFNYGFTDGGGGTASFTGGDAQALFDAAHTRTDGGATQSNTSTMDLAEDALEVAMIAMRSTLDNKGQLFLVQPGTLVVPPTLEKEARILLNSTERPGTANNDINPYQGSLRLMVWDYLGAAAGGSDTAWFVLDQSVHRLNWFWRERPDLDGPEYDFDTKTAKWSVLYRASVGFSDWRGAWGSTGTNA